MLTDRYLATCCIAYVLCRATFVCTECNLWANYLPMIDTCSMLRSATERKEEVIFFSVRSTTVLLEYSCYWRPTYATSLGSAIHVNCIVAGHSGSIRVTGSLWLFIIINRNEWLRVTYLCLYWETVLQAATVFHSHTLYMSRTPYSSWWLSRISHYWLNNISQCTVKDSKLRCSCRSDSACSDLQLHLSMLNVLVIVSVMLIGCTVYIYRLHSVETWLHWPQTASCYHTDILLADSNCRAFIADLRLVQV